MKLEYTLRLADFKAGRRLHRRQKLVRRILPYTWPILTFICLIGAFVFSGTSHKELFGQCFAIGFGALVASIGQPILQFFNIRKSYSRLFHSGRTDRRSFVDINDEYIVRRLAEMSELKILWSGVFGFAQDEKITMIYTNKDCFLLIPTQAMTPAQRIELDELVVRHGVRR